MGQTTVCHYRVLEGADRDAIGLLVAAMAGGSHVALNRHSALVRLLRQQAVPTSDPIWRFIKIEK